MSFISNGTLAWLGYLGLDVVPTIIVSIEIMPTTADSLVSKIDEFRETVKQTTQ